MRHPVHALATHGDCQSLRTIGSIGQVDADTPLRLAEEQIPVVTPAGVLVHRLRPITRRELPCAISMPQKANGLGVYES